MVKAIANQTILNIILSRSDGCFARFFLFFRLNPDPFCCWQFESQFIVSILLPAEAELLKALDEFGTGSARKAKWGRGSCIYQAYGGFLNGGSSKQWVSILKWSDDWMI
jgi:hypothetical protein